jgi:hypothetical protein
MYGFLAALRLCVTTYFARIFFGIQSGGEKRILAIRLSTGLYTGVGLVG